MNYNKKEELIEISQYQKYLYQNPQLTHLFFELTNKCNLRCIHCGSSCKASNDELLDKDMIIKCLDEVADQYEPSAIMVCLSGGEPLLYPHLIEIIGYARKRGFLVGMTTNGTLISNDFSKQLSEAGINTIAISIDGDEAIHDSFRDINGCFQKAIEGARNLKDNNIFVQAITVVNKLNVEKLDDIYSIVMQNGFDSWRLVNIDPIGRAADKRELLLDSNELKYLFSYIKGKRLESENRLHISYGCSHYVGIDFEKEIRDFYFQCSAGLNVGSVLVNGDIVACIDIERRVDLVQGNIYRDNFIDIWENKFDIFRLNRAETSCVCKECDEKEYCRGDAAHTWDYDNRKPRYCIKNI